MVDDGPKLLACANRFGFRCFTDTAAFKRYVRDEVIAETSAEVAA